MSRLGQKLRLHYVDSHWNIYSRDALCSDGSYLMGFGWLVGDFFSAW